MLPTERLAYSAITERPSLRLPNDARLAVWIIVNIEVWDPREPMPRTVLPPPAGSSSIPDIPNWAWHEYGNRVGFWRMLEVFDALKVRATAAGNFADTPCIVPALSTRSYCDTGITHAFSYRVSSPRFASIRFQNRGA